MKSDNNRQAVPREQNTSPFFFLSDKKERKKEFSRGFVEPLISICYINSSRLFRFWVLKQAAAATSRRELTNCSCRGVSSHNNNSKQQQKQSHQQQQQMTATTTKPTNNAVQKMRVNPA